MSGILGKVAHEGAVDLDGIDGQRLEMAKRGEARAEIVERDAAAEFAQRRDEAGRFLDVVQRRGFGDLDDEPAGDLGPALQQRGRPPQPGAIGRGKARDVEAEADPRMRRHLRDRLFQHIAVDQADEAELLDRCDELGGGDDAAVGLDHAQQALVIIDHRR